MKNISHHYGTLQVIGRLPSSFNGNPRYSLFILETSTHGVSCVTPVDSSLGYSITNYDGKKVKATIGTHRNKATLNSIEKWSE